MSTLPILDAGDLPAHPERPSPRRHRAVFTLMAVTIGVVLIAAGLAIAGDTLGQSTTVLGDAAGDSVATALTDSGSTSTAIAGLAAATTATDVSEVGTSVIPSVVTIQVSGTFRNREMLVGSGSGVIWDGSGHIVTNAHVVDAGDSFEVVLSDGRVYTAEIVGVDETTDLAVLAIETTDLTPITLGSAADLQAGDPAIAVGSPLGLDGGPSLTVGVISALGRTVQIDSETTLYGMLQADAPITEGSSGGALVDEEGQLIGITSAVGVSTVGVEGIGFSTPIEIVSRVVEEIIATGTASQPVVGITGTTAYSTTDDGGEEPAGVEVEEVSPGSAAAGAGIAAGDVISSLDGEAINTMEALIAQIRTRSAGDTISLTVTSSGVATTVDIVLGDD